MAEKKTTTRRRRAGDKKPAKTQPEKQNPQKASRESSKMIRDKIADKKARFLRALADQGTIFHAAKKANVPRCTVYEYRHDDKEFNEAVKAILRLSKSDNKDRVKKSLLDKAVSGDVKAIIVWLKMNCPEARKALSMKPPQEHHHNHKVAPVQIVMPHNDRQEDSRAIPENRIAQHLGTNGSSNGHN